MMLHWFERGRLRMPRSPSNDKQAIAFLRDKARGGLQVEQFDVRWEGDGEGCELEVLGWHFTYPPWGPATIVATQHVLMGKPVWTCCPTGFGGSSMNGSKSTVADRPFHSLPKTI
jgi:hypothetical protein